MPGVGIMPVPMFWPCKEDVEVPGVGIMPLEVMGVELGIIPLPCYKVEKKLSEQRTTRPHSSNPTT